MKKKGLSVIIGYVLLVSFVLALGVITYKQLKTYIPSEALECPEGVSIFIKDVNFNCNNSQLDLTLKNNGLFNIAGYFIHATNDPNQTLATIDLSNYTNLGENKGGTVLFKTSTENSFEPNDETTNIFNLSDSGIGQMYSIEIIPVRFQEVDNKMRFVSCGSSRVKEEMVCELTTIELLQNLGAISWWKFEGDGIDELGVNNGTISGADCTVTGRYGQACYFQGSSDMMLLSPVIDLSNTWTIATWFNYPLEEITHWKTLTRGNAGDHQVIVQTGTYNLGTYDNTGSTGFRDSGFDTDTLSNGWHHLVVVQDGTNIIFYIDINNRNLHLSRIVVCYGI